MQTRYFAIVFGIIYTVFGVMGFIPAFLAPPTTDIAVGTLHGRLLGLFEVNILHSLFHLVVGIWGIVAYRSWTDSRLYARSLTVIFAVLAVFGLIPGLNTLFGLLPLFGHDVWLHALTAVIAAYFGFMAPAPATTTATTTAPRPEASPNPRTRTREPGR